MRVVDVTTELARGANPSSRGEPVRCIVWTRGGAIDLKFRHRPYADRPVGLGTCAPDGTLRTGWRATLPCACDEGSPALNCHGGVRAARRVPRADRPYIGPWLDPFNTKLTRHGLGPMPARASLWPGMVRQLEQGASMLVTGARVPRRHAMHCACLDLLCLVGLYLAVPLFSTTYLLPGANAPIGGRASGASARAIELASWLPNPAPCSLYVARRSALRAHGYAQTYRARALIT